MESLNKEIGEGKKSSVDSHWTQYPIFNPLQRNKCWPYFFPSLSGAVWLNKSSPAALSRSLSINIFISLFNYLKHFLCSVYFTQMEVGWAAPSLFKACTAGAWRNVGHKGLLSTPSSTSFTLAAALASPFRAPQTSCFKGHRVSDRCHCSVPCTAQGALVPPRAVRGKQRRWELLPCQTLLAPADKLLPHDV